MNNSLIFFLDPRINVPTTSRHRIPNESNYENTEVEELIAILRETESLEEQGDILQYLVDTQGLDFNTGKRFYKSTQSLIVRSNHFN